MTGLKLTKFGKYFTSGAICKPALRASLEDQVTALCLSAALVCLGFLLSLAPTLAQEEGELRGHGGAIRSMATLAGERLITGGFDSAILAWNLTTARAIKVFRHHDSTVNALAALDQDCFASGGEDGRIALWCGLGTSPRLVLTGHTAPISALVYLRAQGFLASASWDRSVRLWRVSDGAQLRIFDQHDGPVTGLALLGEDTLVSVTYGGRLEIEGGASGGRRQLESPLNAVAVGAGDVIFTAGADGMVRRFDRNLQPLGEISLGNGPLQALALSADGAIAAVAGLRTQITLIDARELTIKGEILGPGLPVWALGFSSDSRELFSGGADRALRRWNPLTGKPSGRDIATAEAPRRINESEAGARVFRACRACHSLEAGDNSRAGPSLHGIMGRRVASAPGYSYSDALAKLDIVWSKDKIAELFDVGPNALLPGTKMPEQRISDPEARQALVDWLAKVTKP